MKTFKYISILVFAALALSGCVKETTDLGKGVDKDGAKVYFDGVKDVYYIRTAEEKEEVKAQMSALTKADVPVSAEQTDDDHISIPVTRKEADAEYEANVILTLPEGSEDLFNVETISYELDGVKTTAPAQSNPDQGGTSLNVSFTFPAKVAKIGIDVKFDIAVLDKNKNYPFSVVLGPNVQDSNYGPVNAEFNILHSAPLHNPWVVVGSIKLDESCFWGYYGGSPQVVNIAIHEHDFTDDSFIGEEINPDKSKRTLKKQPYYRFCIPAYGYQLACASVEAGDGFLEDGEEEYFAESRGIMFNLEAGSYDFMYDIENSVYAAPLAKDVSAGGSTVLFPLLGYNHQTGEVSYISFFDGYMTSEAVGENYFYIHPNYVDYYTLARSANNFEITVLFAQGGSTSLWYADPIYFTWLSNDLVPNWDSYFTVDYNNDIEYAAAGTGTLTSEFKGADIPVQLYQGYDDLYKNDVYYIPAPYAEGEYGIALLVKDGKATLAAEQPIFEESLGKEVFVSQSTGTASKIEFNEKGEIVRITLGMKIHYEGEDNAILEVTEVYTPDANTGSIDDFLGSFIQYGMTLYFDAGDELYSEVNISRIEGNKVAISGLVDETFAGWYGIGDNILIGEYNPNTNQIVIPAQYFRAGLNEGDDATAFPWATEYDEEGNPLDEVTAYAYFQPGEGDYDAYAQNVYFSYISNPSASCALTLEEMAPGIYVPVLTSSPYATYADAYQVDAYYYDAKKGYYDSAASQKLVCDSVNGPVYGTLGAAGGAYVMLIPEAMYSTSPVGGVPAASSSVKAAAPDGRPARFDRKNAGKTDARFKGSFDVKNKIRL